MWLLPAKAKSHRAMVHFLTAPLSTEFPANGPRKAATDGPSIWALAFYEEGPDEAPGSCVTWCQLLWPSGK